ncbi:hypothetical protein IMSAGC020_00814 [Lachnospiraceae bacterium]|nr:hypothetical protein IMSAGC020_00814 [Lachnospiraceae bacterium]
MGCVTTSEALELLKEEGLLEPVMCTVMEKIKEHLAARAKEGIEIGAVMFEPRYGILGMTGNTEALSNKIRRDQDRKE